MRYSSLFFNNNSFCKQNESLELIDLMRKACFVHQDSAGVYSWLSLGLLLERKIESIIHDEMSKIGFSEIRLSLLQDANLWKETGRFDTYGEELFSLRTRGNKQFCLAATCEEAITSIVIDHYNQSNLKLKVYQIGNKYRDELRVKSGLVRSREFVMKDGYSFCNDENCSIEIYNSVRTAYCNILNELGLQYEIINSDNGEIGGKSSEEFLCYSQYGQDMVNNKSALEVAHIFNLGQDYSSKLGLKVGSGEFAYMGCYGIGVSRLMMALLENMRDINGFCGSEKFNTFHTVISAIGYNSDTQVTKIADLLYKQLTFKGTSVLLDDRIEQAGKKLADSELIGCCRRIVVSKNSIAKDSYEVLNRKTMTKQLVSLTYLLE